LDHHHVQNVNKMTLKIWSTKHHQLILNNVASLTPQPQPNEQQNIIQNIQNIKNIHNIQQQQQQRQINMNNNQLTNNMKTNNGHSTTN